MTASSTPSHSQEHPWLLPALLCAGAVVFAFDIITPLGYADFIFYFLPIALSAIQSNPRIPYWLGGYVSVLSIVGYFSSPSGVDMDMARINRTFAVITLWCVAYLVRQIILVRNRVARESKTQSILAELAIAIRGEISEQEIGSRALAIIAGKTDAAVGVLYALKEKDLIRSGVYAFTPEDSGSGHRLSSQEGLPGQAIRERRIVNLTDVPKGYLSIGSSTGRTDPTEIIVVPLMAEDLVTGVMELGLHTTTDDIDREFLQRAADIIGVALRSAVYKAELTRLLKQAQSQSEELQAQQEELRVMNEELEQQTRALKESQVRLENQQAELEQTNQQLEEQTESLQSQKEVLDARNSDLEEVQRRLSEKATDLARTSQFKSEFLANMSHELRTPLNSTLILAKLLSDNAGGNLTDEQVRFAETIYGAGNDLLNLINDILDLSKVEAGKMEIRPETVVLDAVFESLHRTFTPMAEQKKIAFRIEKSPDLVPSVVTDRQKLEQVLKNLLSNAVKFTEKGHVVLRAHNSGSDVHLEVEDTGVGIPASQREVIFEAFRQADGTTNRKFGGTGLGLSISREFTRLLGGRLSVKSEPGQGSTFILEMPARYTVGAARNTSVADPVQSPGAVSARSDPEGVQPAVPKPIPMFSFRDDRDSPNPRERRILIVEDDERFARILFDLAHEMDFDAITAPSAGEGIELVRKYLPHAVLLDIQLPDHNGLTVLDALKSDPATRHIPVHVISSTDATELAHQMGAIRFLQKPTDRGALTKVFQDLERHLTREVKRVLIVEDDLVQRESMTRLLGGKDVEVIGVGSAEEALVLLKSEIFDAIVMDLSLPDLSGFHLLERLSEAESPYSHPPVIVYTGRDLAREEEDQLRKYANSIIIKGARSPERLLSEVSLFLHRVESNLPKDRQKILRDLRNRDRTLEDRKILLVDDDARNIFALTSALEPQGARIEVARNGREAIEKLQKVPDVDLVLMDIMMPEMDGFEATAGIRAQKKFRDLPVIALTAKAMKDDQEKCLAAGANDYLAKPIDFEKLLSLIRVWLPVRRGWMQ